MAALRFPPVPGQGSPLLEGPEAIEQAILTLLLTEPGERAGRLAYGAGLRRLLHQPENLATHTAARQAVAEAIRRWLPWVQLVDGLVRSGEAGALDIDVRYRAPGDRAARSLRYALPLDPEAT